MILYLDTSSLVKLYVEEEYSDLIKEWVREAETVSTCRVAYPEAVSAFNGRFNSGDLSEDDYKLILKRFSQEWKKLVALDFDELEAGRLVKKHGLRGFDAVHLSAAKLLKSDKDISLSFSSFDKKLNDAASAEGLTVLSAVVRGQLPNLG
ncbi:MAG: toxin, family [Deltaproteobacteria bacterium]|nr:toxin, family [Deltaproteobacteria bacterium]